MTFRAIVAVCILAMGCGRPSPALNESSNTVAADNQDFPAKTVGSTLPETIGPPTSSAAIQTAIARVELSDPKVERIGGRKLRAAVNYRFLAGSPDPERTYLVYVQFIGAPFFEHKRFPGTQLQTTGRLTWEFELPDINGPKVPAPDRYSMALSESSLREGRPGYLGCSNSVESQLLPDAK